MLSGSGFRDTGFVADRWRVHPRFSAEAIDRNLHLVARIKAIAGHRGITAGQLALAWVLSKGGDIAPIPGTKRRKYLEENAAAADVVLSVNEIAELESAVPQGEVVGARASVTHLTFVDR